MLRIDYGRQWESDIVGFFEKVGFELFFKEGSESAFRMLGGKEFQWVGAVTAKGSVPQDVVLGPADLRWRGWAQQAYIWEG